MSPENTDHRPGLPPIVWISALILFVVAIEVLWRR